MPTKSFHVRDEIAKRMEEFSDTNWAEVCVRAVEAELDYLAALELVGAAHEQALARFRGERGKVGRSDRAKAVEAAARWASGTATLKDLRGMAEWSKAGRFKKADAAIELAQFLNRGPNSLWEECLPDVLNQLNGVPDDLVVAFAQGAAKVYDRIRPKLDMEGG